MEVGSRTDRSGQVRHEAATENGSDTLQNPREQVQLLDKGNNDKHRTVLDGTNVATEIKGIVETNIEGI